MGGGGGGGGGSSVGETEKRTISAGFANSFFVKCAAEINLS